VALKLAAFNEHHRERVDPAIRRALGGRRAARAWANAVRLRLPDGPIESFRSDGEALRRALN
jgi:hypothetical protein